MEKIYIKKLDKEIEIDTWIEANKISVKIIQMYLIDNNLSTGIIDNEINNNGFSIDFKVEKNISENSLPFHQGKIKKLLSKDLKVNSELPTTMIKELILRGVSGLTLKNGQQGNRIFGFASISKKQFESKLSEIENIEQRDHRKVAKDLDLFFIDESSGKGLPIWLENGVLLKRQIQKYIWEQEEKYGSEQVETPVLGSLNLYKTSGHYDHYRENMFPVMEIEGNEKFILRPMACPHHVLIYKRKPRSFRDLPIRISENVKQFRYEHSGSLIGLERTRSMELTDSHIFLREDQLKSELKKGFELIEETLAKFNIKINHIELALHDPNDIEKYHGKKELWEKSEKMLKTFLDENKIKYVSIIGEAAFYGPKIDVQIKTALGHDITISTIQIDFFLPEKFKLAYIDSDKQKIQPIMLHRGLIGTYERFISVLLEQTKGDLPMWLAPQQAVILPVNNEYHLEYAKKIYDILKKENVRVKIDDSNDRLSNKIRIYQKAKVKTQIIIGDEEVKNNTVSYRFFGKNKTMTISIKNIESLY